MLEKKTAKSIAKFRERDGNIAMDTLEYVPKLKMSKRLYESIDFTPNPQYDYSALEEGIDAPRIHGKMQSEPDTNVIAVWHRLYHPERQLPHFMIAMSRQLFIGGPSLWVGQAIPFLTKQRQKKVGGGQQSEILQRRTVFRGTWLIQIVKNQTRKSFTKA